ncbi:MAG TPA: hypothetical protein VKR06_07135 [Ktedonosporobacter sp.]|nr:hypothetical protein [Ktedonosporobacter sp.]
MHEILRKLEGGDRRSIGRSNEVVVDVLHDPALFEIVFYGMLCADPLIRMRAADAIEKITALYPSYLQPYKDILIQQVACSEQQEVRWHVAQMLPRLRLEDREECSAAFDILLGYLRDRSKIVKTFSMQALADLGEQHLSLLPLVRGILEECTQTGSAAMQSRGRQLLRRLKSMESIETTE